jgi:hypothetical protein
MNIPPLTGGGSSSSRELVDAVSSCSCTGVLSKGFKIEEGK